MQLNENHVAACPFCGSLKAPIPERSAVTQSYFVHCDRNEGGCGARSGHFVYEYDASHAWHRRPEDEEESLTILQKIMKSMESWKYIDCHDQAFTLYPDGGWYFSYFDDHGLPCTGFSGDDLESLDDRLSYL